MMEVRRKKMKAAKWLFTLYLILLLQSSASFSKELSENEKLFQKARNYFFTQKFAMAEVYFREVIKSDPENALAYSYLGDILLNKNSHDQALGLYKKALDIKPDIAENYFRIGQIYYYKKMGGPAIQNFERSVKIDSSIKFAYYHIGLTYLMLERDKENTIKNWEKYLSIAPEDYQYDKIQRVIDLLRDPNFKLPSKDSEISIEEALRLGGATLEVVNRESVDKKAGHESKKTVKKVEEIYLDDDL